MVDGLPLALTRVGPSPVRDLRTSMVGAQQHAAAQELQVKAVLAALSALPQSAVRGPTTVTIVHAGRGPGPADVRLTVEATRFGRPLAGWDTDHVVRNPRLDVVDMVARTVREDPAARILNDMLDIADSLP